MSNNNSKNNISQPYEDDYSYDNNGCKYNIDNFYSFSSNNPENFGNILKYNQVSNDSLEKRETKNNPKETKFGDFGIEVSLSFQNFREIAIISN